MLRRLFSLLLAVLVLVGTFALPASAAPTLEEAMAEVNVYAKNMDLNWLTMNGSIKTQHYTYYNYTSPISGETQEIPAYCVDPRLYGVPALVPEGTAIKYSGERLVSDPKVCGIIANGYPHITLETLGVNNVEEAYYATKTALWIYLLDSWSLDGLGINPNLNSSDRAAAERVLQATRDIYWRGMQWDSLVSPKLTVSADRETAYPVQVDGQAYAQSPALRRRLEVGTVLLTCLGAGIEPAYDNVERLKRQPVFLPAFALRGGNGNLMNAASCVGFGHWGNCAYLLQYASRQSPGFFMNNELSHLHNLASVFSERLDTPQALILAGESYRSLYELISTQTPSERNGKKGFIDYSQAYPQLGIPVSLVACDDTGVMQLAIMRQENYRARIAQAAFGARWNPKDSRLPEADGHVDGNPLVIAVDMDLRRLERVCRDAVQQSRREILVAALEGQMSGLLLDQFPRGAPIRALRINHQVLAAAFGDRCVTGDPWPDEPLRWKGGLVHV